MARSGAPHRFPGRPWRREGAWAIAVGAALVLLPILAAGAWTLARSLDAVAAPTRPAVVWAVGDGADGSPTAKRLAARIAQRPIDRLLYLGDVYPYGTYREFLSNYEPVYGRLAGRTLPTPGNHEWPNHAVGYDRYWAAVRGRRQPHYYARSLGDWEIISLNSQEPIGRGSPQLRWLERQLARGRGNCRLAFWHRPRFSAGTRHGDQADVQPLWDALRGHARLVLNGHEHNSQRFTSRDGIVQLIAGAGRGSLYPLRRDRRLAFGNDDRQAALRLVLEPGRARFAFVAADGRRLDSGQVRCRA